LRLVDAKGRFATFEEEFCVRSSLLQNDGLIKGNVLSADGLKQRCFANLPLT